MSPTLFRVWESLEFWFSKKPSGYYKFLKPCNHKWYRVGDSWCEHLRISENTFRKSLKKLCTTYQSKSEFLAAKDTFQGKPYACYFDRIRKVTFYFRNSTIADALTKENFLDTHCASECVSINTAINKNKIFPPKSPMNAVAKKRDMGSLSNDLIKKTLQTQTPLSQTAIAMHQIWNDETQGKIETPRLSLTFAEKLLKALQTYFHNCLEKWRAYCRTIASSKFLMGEVGSFKAWLVWVIREDTIQKVREGGYNVSVPSETPAVPTINPENPLGDVQEEQTKDKPVLRATLVHLAHTVGLAFYRSWFGDAEVREEGSNIIFHGLTPFAKDRINTYLEMKHPDWEKRICFR